MTNLTNGQILKNYKELCEVMNWKVQSGTSKMAQFKELDRICKWHKEGNKIVIDEIFINTKKKVDGRGKSMNSRGNNKNQYIENIELSIIGMLVKDNNEFGELIGSKNILLEKFGLINKNYVFCKRRQNKLSNYLGVDFSVVADFYKNVDSMVVNNFESALNNLNKRKLIIWNSTIMICKNITESDKYKTDKEFIKATVINEYGEKEDIWTLNEKVDIVFAEAAKKEKQIILKCEKQILNDMGYDNIKRVFANNKVEEYYNRVYELIRSKDGMKDFRYYYKAYKMIYNIDDIIDELHKLGYEEFEEEHKQLQKGLTNIGVKNKSIKNAKSRVKKAKSEPTENNAYRRQLSFLDDYSNVIDNVIDKDKESIVKNVRNSLQSNKKSSGNESMPF